MIRQTSKKKRNIVIMDKQSYFLYTLQHHSNSLKKFREPMNDRSKKLLPSAALTHQFSSKTLQSPIFKAKNNFEQFYNSINRKTSKPLHTDQSLEKPAESLPTVFPLERISKIKGIVGTTDFGDLSDG